MKPRSPGARPILRRALLRGCASAAAAAIVPFGAGVAAARGGNPRVATLDQLKDAVPSPGALIDVEEAQRGGPFAWLEGDHSLDVAADTSGAIVVAPARDRSGRTGAWRRQWNGPIEPEWFGAMGDGVVSDDSALFAMAAWGRHMGRLDAVFRRGRVYTHKRPFFLAGIRHLRIDGNGASIMNIAGSDRASTFFANYEGLCFPCIFMADGPNNFIATPYVLGNPIASARRGDGAVTMLAGTVPVTAGQRVLIHGFNCLAGADGFPICPKNFEANRVAGVAGGVVHLEQPLRYAYDARWPDFGTRVPCGRPRIVPADRPDFVQIETLELLNLRIRAYPGWTAPGASAENNGRLTIAGFDRAVLKGIEIDGGLYVSQGGKALIEDCRIGSTVESDKCLDGVTYKNTAMQSHILGNGTREIAFIDCTIREALIANPIENLEIVGGTIGGTGGQHATLLGLYRAVENIHIKGTTFVCDDPKKGALLPKVVLSVKIQAAEGTSLAIAAEDYHKSSLCHSVAEGGILYDQAGWPAFRIGELPYAEGGRIVIDGERLADIKPGDALSQSYIGRVLAEDVRFAGPYGAQIGTLPNGFLPPPAGFDIIDVDRGPGSWRIRSSHLDAQKGLRFFEMGANVAPERVTIDVSRAYAGGGPAPLLTLQRRLGAFVAAVDLGRPGRRVIEMTGVTGAMGADRLSPLGTDPFNQLVYHVEAKVAGREDDMGAAEWSILIAGTRMLKSR